MSDLPHCTESVEAPCQHLTSVPEHAEGENGEVLRLNSNGNLDLCEALRTEQALCTERISRVSARSKIQRGTGVGTNSFALHGRHKQIRAAMKTRWLKSGGIVCIMNRYDLNPDDLEAGIAASRAALF